MSFSLNVLLEEKILHTVTEFFPFKWKNSIFSENIIDVSVTKDFIIVTTKYLNQDTNEAIANNINAYDWDGNHLWNISDIIKNNTLTFWGGTLMPKKIVNECDEFDDLKCQNVGELYRCISFDNHIFTIDLTNKKVILIQKHKC